MVQISACTINSNKNALNYDFLSVIDRQTHESSVIKPELKPESLRNYARGVGRTRRPLTDVIPVVPDSDYIFSFERYGVK